MDGRGLEEGEKPIFFRLCLRQSFSGFSEVEVGDRGEPRTRTCLDGSSQTQKHGNSKGGRTSFPAWK